MKKIILSAALFLSITAFAQKEELKALKKIYAKEKPSTKDIESYKTNLTSAISLATEESDKVYANFYKGMLPLVELSALGEKATPMDQMRIFTSSTLDNLASAISETLEYEKKVGKKVYTDDIKETVSTFKPMLVQVAFQFNNNKQYKEASSLFYGIYKLDKSDGSNLENAAILALQDQDYVLAEKLYEEFIDSDYFKTAVLFFARNKTTETEEQLPDRVTRMKLISLGTHDKPREEKISARKPEITKTIALLSAQNGNKERSFVLFEEALALSPNDTELLNGKALLYLQVGYAKLAEDDDLVQEINKNIDNKKKYDELIEKRKVLFRKALPDLEKSYELNDSDYNTKELLRLSYEILGMSEKAASIKD